MEIKTIIPTEYTPFDEIILCSNKLLKVNKIIDDKGFIPLFIGQDKKNKKPNIWLQTKTKEGFIQLIDKNKPLINIIELNEYTNGNQMDVILKNQNEKHIIIQIENIEGIPSITKLDLRTLGYNIYGDDKILHIGDMKMSGNSFQVDTFIGM